MTGGKNLNRPEGLAIRDFQGCEITLLNNWCFDKLSITIDIVELYRLTCTMQGRGKAVMRRLKRYSISAEGLG